MVRPQRKKRVCVVITARASYARIKTALTAIDKHDHLELLLIVAASAVLDRYGSAIEVIEKDGFKITARVFNVIEGGDLLGQAKTTGLGIIELSNVINGLDPDVVVTIADRYETMATAISAAYLNIPLVHIQGGEVSGNIDEKVRHAITKLSDLHLVSTAEAQVRVIKMGEVPERVIVTGCPSIDLAKEVATNGQLDFDPYQKYGGVGAAPKVKNGYLIVMQHPVTTEYQAARKQIEETLYAVFQSQKTTLWFWPNVDAGSDGTSNGIRAFRERHVINSMHFFKNMEPLDFLKALKNCACLIGNSSVGLREAAYLGVPSINIGTRQHGRSRATNVIDVDYDRKAIKQALEDQLKHGTYPQSTLYGTGDAGKRIADVLANTEIKASKFLTY